MTSPSALDFFSGFREGQLILKKRYPTVGLDLRTRHPNHACGVCLGRGLLAFPSGEIKNNGGAVVVMISEHYLPCPDCVGYGIHPSLLASLGF